MVKKVTYHASFPVEPSELQSTLELLSIVRLLMHLPIVLTHLPVGGRRGKKGENVPDNDREKQMPGSRS